MTGNPQRLRATHGTEVVAHPRRQQPYTIWIKGEAVQFCETLEEAQRWLREEVRRGYLTGN